MLRLYVIGEGQTEQTFASTILGPHLFNFEIHVFPTVIGNARSHGVIHRGGVSSYQRVRNDIRRYCEQHKSKPDVFFTTMLDLYALPNDFPAVQETRTLSPHDRVAALETAFAADVTDPRFVPHIQLHEFEAYLFSDVSRFGER